MKHDMFAFLKIKRCTLENLSGGRTNMSAWEAGAFAEESTSAAEFDR